MTHRCAICKQPITNTPYHFQHGNRNRCQKHCSCTRCNMGLGRPVDEHVEARADDDGISVANTVLATELFTEALSTESAATPDPTPNPALDTPDFGGFDGGSSGGGGADGSF